METPQAKRYQQIHYGHCAFLPPEERRFITEDLIRSTGGLIGTPDEIIAQLREREAMGLSEITLLPAMKTARRNLEDFAEKVIARY
jgi:hypothetical protein